MKTHANPAFVTFSHEISRRLLTGYKRPPLGGGSHEWYVDQREVARELRNANALMAKHGWRCIDVSYKATEEVAREILNMMGR